jgi:hypothetical protein
VIEGHAGDPVGRSEADPEARGDLVHREGRDLGRGQLDREGDPAEPPADLRHGQDVLFGQREARRLERSDSFSDRPLRRRFGST